MTRSAKTFVPFRKSETSSFIIQPSSFPHSCPAVYCGAWFGGLAGDRNTPRSQCRERHSRRGITRAPRRRQRRAVELERLVWECPFPRDDLIRPVADTDRDI